MKLIQNPDGTISISDEKNDSFTNELNYDIVKSEVPQTLIDECERLYLNDGITRFIFDNHLTNTVIKRNSTKGESRDLTIDEILGDEYYISDENDFNLMPSRFPYYDTETKMTCRWSKHKIVADFLKKLGFEPGFSNMGPEFEQSFILSIYNSDGSILYKSIIRIQPNLFVNLISEYGDFIENKKTTFKGFFKKSSILSVLEETTPKQYKSILRELKLNDVLGY